MKLHPLMFILAGVLGVSAAATAQTCGTPTPFNTPPGAPTFAGTTCGQGDPIALYCGSLDSSSRPDYILSVHLAAEGSADRTVTSITLGGGAAGFDPVALLYTGACNTGDGCVASADATNPMPMAGVAQGDYLLAVSAAAFNAAGACGAFTLNADGTLPVELQNFSVN